MAFNPNSPAQTHNAFGDLDAIRENFAQLRKFESAASEPSNPAPGLIWLDTSGSPPVMKQRNATNTAWFVLWTFDNTPIKHPSGGAQGDVLYHNGSSFERLPAGTTGFVLKTLGAGALHQQSVEEPTVIGLSVLEPEEAGHAQAAEELDLSQANVLAVAESGHDQAADGVTLAQVSFLAISDTVHDQLAEGVELEQLYVLAVADALHGQKSMVLTVQGQPVIRVGSAWMKL